MSALEAAAQGLVDLAAAKWQSVRDAHADLTGATVRASLDAGARQDSACAEFKATFYPRRAGRVVATESGIFLQSPTGRVTTVFVPAGAR